MQVAKATGIILLNCILILGIPAVIGGYIWLGLRLAEAIHYRSRMLRGGNR